MFTVFFPFTQGESGPSIVKPRAPGGMTCRGYDNATVSIRFPDGAGQGCKSSTCEMIEM